MYLIIFTGAPASGKSSIAVEVAKRLQVSCYSKDSYKIMLFEKFGFNTHFEKRKLSSLAEKMLFDQINISIKEDVNIVVDNFFKDFTQLKSIIGFNDSCKVIRFLLVADLKILADRYHQRICSGNRHMALYTTDVYPVVEGISTFCKTMDSDNAIRVQKEISQDTFGDFVFEINTNNIDTQFNDIISKVMHEIKNMEDKK